MKPEKQLYQWDVNQYLTGINPAAQYVDYTIGNDVIRLETDGTRCRIPDEVLQTYGGKTCYERYPDGTFRAYSFSVLYAPKPPGYIYTPEERTTFEALTDRVDAAIEDIKRRADSGEFTPKKGVDYFTEAEKNELMESVSTGAIGEFRNVVDTATTEYNDNHNLKLDKYNANASEKLTTYDTNAEQHTTDYNRNAAEKLEAYNQNHTEKVAEYNANAETKTAEFDSNAAALQTEVDRLRAEKANVDGYYEEMTVGDAEQLVSTQFVEDNEPYLFRPTGGSSDVGNRAYLDKIVGGTVVWNQLVQDGNFTDASSWITNNVTMTVSNNTATVTQNNSNGYINKRVSTVSGHRCLSMVGIKGVAGKKYSFNDVLTTFVADGTWQTRTGIFTPASSTTHFVIAQRSEDGFPAEWQIRNACIFDLTAMFGSTIADYIYSLEQSQAGAGVAWFKKLFPKDYYEYNAGELLSVEGLQSHDTVGFNLFDKNTMVVENVYIDNVDGVEKSNTGALSTGFIPVIPNAAYFINTEQTVGGWGAWYDADKNYISGITGYANADPAYKVKTAPDNAHYMRLTCRYNNNGNINTFCVNLSDPSRNGEYEEYVKHSYPLDSSLTLRGIPKLDASNNLHYDGDEYASDGKVTRKYGVVDLGSLNWIYTTFGGHNQFNAIVPNIKSNSSGSTLANALLVGYTNVVPSDFYENAQNKTFCINNTLIRLADTAYTDAATFKAAMSGVMLVYELATPTTETAEPFQNIQIVDDFGTEEFVNTGMVPVGHNTRYPANLRDKLQHLPSLASADGTYLIQQSGKQMSLIHTSSVFPNTPTEDGTYTLKTVVTGGIATLQWVTE